MLLVVADARTRLPWVKVTEIRYWLIFLNEDEILSELRYPLAGELSGSLGGDGLGDFSCG